MNATSTMECTVRYNKEGFVETFVVAFVVVVVVVVVVGVVEVIEAVPSNAFITSFTVQS